MNSLKNIISKGVTDKTKELTLYNTAHKTTLQNHSFSCGFYWSDSTGKERDEETGYGYFGARYLAILREEFHLVSIP